MRSLISKLAAQVRKSEAGFTLVELLVVVGIIVALAAVIIPNVAQFTSKGTEGANAAEQENVQTAFDTLMADAGVSAIQARTGSAAMRNFTGLPVGTSGALTVNGATADLTQYLRGNPTNFYCWSSSGLVTPGTGTC